MPTTKSVIIAGEDTETLYYLHLVSCSIPDAEVVGEAADKDELTALAMGLQPNFVILTSEFGGRKGLNTAMYLQEAGVNSKFLIVNPAGEPEFVILMDEKGVKSIGIGMKNE